MLATIGKNRRELPNPVQEIKLKREELYCQQNKGGITVLKWKDERDLLMISTTHSEEIGESNKPVVVEDYNKLMGYVDQSDQMVACSPFV